MPTIVGAFGTDLFINEGRLKLVHSIVVDSTLKRLRTRFMYLDGDETQDGLIKLERNAAVAIELRHPDLRTQRWGAKLLMCRVRISHKFPIRVTADFLLTEAL